MTHVLPLVGHVRFALKFKNLYRWRSHRGERKDGEKMKKSEQDGKRKTRWRKYPFPSVLTLPVLVQKGFSSKLSYSIPFDFALWTVFPLSTIYGTSVSWTGNRNEGIVAWSGHSSFLTL
ncbi:hypothetical protein TNCV_1580401 [Trichonephila clavipes]|nr:hypothetical protein TNCV_1580401 [Trichonephila clavipes]